MGIFVERCCRGFRSFSGYALFLANLTGLRYWSGLSSSSFCFYVTIDAHSTRAWTMSVVVCSKKGPLSVAGTAILPSYSIGKTVHHNLKCSTTISTF